MSLKEEFDRDGFAVFRGNLGRVSHLLEAWNEFNENVASKRAVRWNPGEVVGPFPPQLDVSRLFTDEARQLLECNVAVYNFRFIVKDKLAPGGTFVHNDLAYHVGSQRKLSAFLAFSNIIPENGGLWFWPGTHRYGYLGDAGEINPDVLPVKVTPVCPVLAPGDVVYMNSATWHHSLPNTIGLDRVMADIIYCDAHDAALGLPRDNLFVRSRVSRIRELEAELSAQKRNAEIWKAAADAHVGIRSGPLK